MSIVTKVIILLECLDGLLICLNLYFSSMKLQEDKYGCQLSKSNSQKCKPDQQVFKLNDDQTFNFLSL